MSRWNGEASLEILTDLIQIDGNFDLTTESRTKDKDFELGVEELHVTLNSRPRLDKFAFPIEMKNLVAHFQPPLTPQEIIEGCIRPDRIVNSYALYHKSRRWNEYKTGKFGQLLRLDIHDDAGMTEWCPYRIDENLLIIEPPKRFLDRAKFPLAVGELTFGKTDIGGGWNPFAGYIVALTAMPTDGDGTVQSITAYLDRVNNDVNVKCTVYEYVGVGDAGSPDGTTEEKLVTEAIDGWVTFNYEIPKATVVNNTNYFLSIWADVVGSINDIQIAQDAMAQGGMYEDEAYGAWPDPLTGEQTSGQARSIYATYTVGEILKEVEDSLGLSDAALRDKTFSVSDGLGLSDALLRDKSFPVADVLGLSEAALVDKVFLILDSVGLSEAVTLPQVSKVVADALALGDTALTDKQLLTVADVLQLTDEALRGKLFEILDSISLTDVADMELAFLGVILIALALQRRGVSIFLQRIGVNLEVKQRGIELEVT